MFESEKGIRIDSFMSVSDEQLNQLAIAAQQSPPLTLERQTALRQMVNGILASGRLCHPQRGQFSGCYEEIYDEAVQHLLLFICQNIEQYKPERASVMGWANMLLERRFFTVAIGKVLGKPNVKPMTLVDLDAIAPPEHSPNLTSQVFCYLVMLLLGIDSDRKARNKFGDRPDHI